MSALDGIYLDIFRYLNLTNLRPFLRAKQLFTEDELERLEIGPTNTRQQAVENLVKFLKTKGPHHEYDFLDILKLSMEEDPHQGHATIIEALEKQLNSPLQGADPKDTITDSVIHNDNSDTSRPQQPEFRLQDVQDVLAEQMNPKHTLDVGNIDYITGKDQHQVAAIRSRVAQANESIIMKFASLVLNVYRLLKQKNIPVEEVRMSLLFLGCLSKSQKEEQIPIFSPTSDIAHAQTLHALIECLHSYSSWYNYGLLKFSAIEFGEEDGKQLIAEYEDELAQYFVTIVAYQCPQFSLTSGLPRGYDHLIVKVDWDYMSRKARDVAMFQSKLSTLLKLKPEVFILKSVEDGCMMFTWAIPASVVPYVLSKAIELRNTLATHDIMELRVGGKSVCIRQQHSHKPQSKPGECLEAATSCEPSGVHKALCEIPSTDSSPLSELSGYSSYKHWDAYSSKHSSRSSTLLVVDRNSLTVDEADILSIYSCGSPDLSSILSSVSPLTEKPTTSIPVVPDKGNITRPLKIQSHISHPFFSESDILSASAHCTPPERPRATSVPNSPPVQTFSVTTPTKPFSTVGRVKKFLRQLISPSKQTTPENSKQDTTASSQTLQILNLTEEPSPRRDAQFVYYNYTTETPSSEPPNTATHSAPPVSLSSHSSLKSPSVLAPLSPILLPINYKLESGDTSEECTITDVTGATQHPHSVSKEEEDTKFAFPPPSILLPKFFRDSENVPITDRDIYTDSYVYNYPRSESDYTVTTAVSRVTTPMSSFSRRSSGYYSIYDVRSIASSGDHSCFSDGNSQETFHQVPSRTHSLKHKLQLENMPLACSSTKSSTRHSIR